MGLIADADRTAEHRRIAAEDSGRRSAARQCGFQQFSLLKISCSIDPILPAYLNIHVYPVLEKQLFRKGRKSSFSLSNVMQKSLENLHI